MTTKSENKNGNENKTTNPKKGNPITLDTQTSMNKPVRGLPKK